MKDFQDKVVLITGAATGIGQASAWKFAREGADLVISTRKNEKGLKNTAEEIEKMGRRVLTVMADVSRREDAERMVEKTMAEFGRVDILMNNAGVGLTCEIKDMELSDWEWVLGINLWGSIYTLNLLLPQMVERRSGHIVIVASGAGLVALPANGAYTASKFALVGMSEVLRTELERFQIGVTAVCPGVVRTNIFDSTKLKGFRREVTKSPEFMGITSEQAAEKIIRAVKKNQAVLVLTAFAKATHIIKRVSPALGREVARGMLKQFLRQKER